MTVWALAKHRNYKKEFKVGKLLLLNSLFLLHQLLGLLSFSLALFYIWNVDTFLMFEQFNAFFKRTTPF